MAAHGWKGRGEIILERLQTSWLVCFTNVEAGVDWFLGEIMLWAIFFHIRWKKYCPGQVQYHCILTTIYLSQWGLWHSWPVDGLPVGIWLATVGAERWTGQERGDPLVDGLQCSSWAFAIDHSGKGWWKQPSENTQKVRRHLRPFPPFCSQLHLVGIYLTICGSCENVLNLENATWIILFCVSLL